MKKKTKILLVLFSLSLLICLIPLASVFAGWSPPTNVTINNAQHVSYFTSASGSAMETGFYYVAGTNEVAYCVDAEVREGVTRNRNTPLSKMVTPTIPIPVYRIVTQGTFRRRPSQAVVSSFRQIDMRVLWCPNGRKHTQPNQAYYSLLFLSLRKQTKRNKVRVPGSK